jgi:OHCU decarboxylase
MADEPRLPPIQELNRFSPETLAQALRPLFEMAPPLAAALAVRRPFRSYEELLDTAEQVLAGLPEAARVKIIDAHPRLGEPPQALREHSVLSSREQGYGGAEDQDEETVLRSLAELNRAYERRFGFRFVVFVNRRPKAAIIPILRERMTRQRDEEMHTALAEMLAIARDRLHTLRSRK